MLFLGSSLPRNETSKWSCLNVLSACRSYFYKISSKLIFEVIRTPPFDLIRAVKECGRPTVRAFFVWKKMKIVLCILYSIQKCILLFLGKNLIEIEEKNQERSNWKENIILKLLATDLTGYELKFLTSKYTVLLSNSNHYIVFTINLNVNEQPPFSFFTDTEKLDSKECVTDLD